VCVYKDQHKHIKPVEKHPWLKCSNEVLRPFKIKRAVILYKSRDSIVYAANILRFIKKKKFPNTAGVRILGLCFVLIFVHTWTASVRSGVLNDKKQNNNKKTRQTRERFFILNGIVRSHRANKNKEKDGQIFSF